MTNWPAAPRKSGPSKMQQSKAASGDHRWGLGTTTNRSAFGQMPRYCFDERDNEKFLIDDEGVEIDTFEHVKEEASRAMADFAKDVLPGSIVRLLAIEVRDRCGPVLRVSLRFEIEQVVAQ
jgi:hypothetical protein